MLSIIPDLIILPLVHIINMSLLTGVYPDFKQWTTTDRTELTSITLPLNVFIDILTEKLDKITTHSFIAISQSSYLKHLKETIGPDEVIVLGDCRKLFFLSSR